MKNKHTKGEYLYLQNKKKMETLKKYLTDAFIQLNEEYKNAKWSDTY